MRNITFQLLEVRLAGAGFCCPRQVNVCWTIVNKDDVCRQRHSAQAMCRH